MNVKNLKRNTDAKMESHPKSATAENNLYNASYYIIQKKENRSKIWSSEQTFRGSCVATAKPHVGLSMTFTKSGIEWQFYS